MARPQKGGPPDDDDADDVGDCRRVNEKVG